MEVAKPQSQPTQGAAWSAGLPHLSPVHAFSTVFMAVFLLIFLGSALVTSLLPETYQAIARVSAADAAALAVFQSATVLKAVSQQLHLPETLAARYGEKNPWADQRVEDLLRRSVQAQRLPGTSLMEIRAYGRSPDECAQLANGLAESGMRQAGSGPAAVQLVDKAMPPLRPVRPNKPLNLTLGALVGVFLGIMAGGVGAKLAVGFEASPKPRP